MDLSTDFDLSGLIDMHIHTAPDIKPRYCNDIQAAGEAKAAGMQAILLKSHITLTADRAAIAESIIGDIRVFGGLVLNKTVGGLNPAAVEVAIQLGAKEIWMPTRDAANVLNPTEKDHGITIFTPSHQIRNEVRDILDLIHQADVILGTGHLSIEETLALVRLARQHEFRKLLITHPDSSLVRMPVETQVDISGEGVFFERCFIDTTPAMNCTTSIQQIASTIRKIGPNANILATDFGMASLPPPVQGMREFLTGLTREGISWDDIYTMAKEIPSYLLDL